jgi:photosystem II stability/assembly factor-like uncharacterized protein
MKYKSFYIIGLCFISVQTYCQWEHLQNQPGGQIRSMTRIYNTLYALTSGSIYQSSNNGIRWEYYQNQTISSATQLIEKNGRVFAVSKGQLYISDDTCVSWRAIPQYQSQQTSLISFISIEGDYIFASTNSSILRASLTDFKWELVHTTFPDNYLSGFASQDSIIVAGSRYCVIRSTDYGTTWTDLIDSMPVFEPNILQIVSVDTVFYASGKLLFRSTDRGIHWDTVKNNSQPIGYGTLYVQDSEMYFSGTRLYKSTNNGLSWNILVDSINNTYGKIRYRSDDGIFTSNGAFDRIYFSADNGASWIVRDSGIAEQSTRVMIDHHDRLYLGLMNSGLLRSDDHGENWIYPRTYEKTFTPVSFAVSGDSIFMATQSSVYLSVDKGESWQIKGQLGNNIIPQKIYCKDNKIYLLAMNGRILRSIDGGNNWFLLEFTMDMGSTPTVFFLDNILYYFTREGGMYKYFEDNVEKVSTPILEKNIKYVFCTDTLLVIQSNTSNTIYQSSDHGITWLQYEQVTDPPLYINEFIYTNRLLFIQTLNNVFVSSNNGISYAKLSENISGRITTITLDSTFLYAGTLSTGTWRMPLKNIHTLLKTNVVVAHHDSILCYPNPSSHTITLTLIPQQKQNTINIEIVDIHGKKYTPNFLYTITDAAISAIIDLTSIPSGMYYINCISTVRSTSIPFIKN